MSLFDEALRERARAHLARFERRAAPANGLRPAAVAVVLLPDDEGRACLLVFQDVRRDDPSRLNPSLVMRMSHNTMVGFDVPYLWYGWKGVRFDEKTFDEVVDPRRMARPPR